MFVVWFKKDGDWHWVEVFLKDTADVVREALIAKGYEVTNSSFDPKKYSTFNQGVK